MKKILLITLLSLTSPLLNAEPRIMLGEFSKNNLNGWEQKSFQGETRYQLQTLDKLTALKAESHDSGSGLFKEQRIDLEKTPILHWSWRINNRLTGLNEQSKAGDDYAARIYVVVKGGLAIWNTKAINYVWSSNSAKNTVWENAFAGKNTMMIALKDATAPLNEWQQEKRDVRADFKKLFGGDIRSIDAVAIMTDTDNSHGEAAAFYGDIWFSKE